MNKTIFCLGNWKQLQLYKLRLSPEITCNKGFFSMLIWLISTLKYIEDNYILNNKKISLLYFSHNYGIYPYFNVLSEHILLKDNLLINNNCNYDFNENNNIEFIDIGKFVNNKLSTIIKNNNSYKNFYTFKNFNYYFNKYFIFSNNINIKVNEFHTKNLNNKKTLGLHYRGTDKLRVKSLTSYSINDFIKVINIHLKNNNYDNIFITSDDKDFFNIIKNEFSNYNILHYDDISSLNINKKRGIHINNLIDIENIIENINKNNINNIIDKNNIFEQKLKEKTIQNSKQLEDIIIISIILSKCNCVIKTHSQLSAFSKIINPNLEIYSIKSLGGFNYFPESKIPLYPNLQNILS